MAVANGTSNGIEVKKRDQIDLGESATQEDIWKGAGMAGALGGGGVFPIYFSGGFGGLGGGVGGSNDTLPELPPYWSKARDVVLTNTMKREPFWNGAVKKAIAKGVTQQWDLKFNERNRNSAEKLRELFKASNGRQGFKHFLNQHLQDYFLTDNGSFIEIDREDNSKPGSKIIGLYHLDSFRSFRTGDPDVPVVYADLHNNYHFMTWWQVWSIADTPNARNNYFGVGDCAAGGAYERIRRMVAIRLFEYQRMTGGSPQELVVVGGLTPQHLENLQKQHEAQRMAKGNSVFGGAMVLPVMTKDPVSLQSIPIAQLPPNYNEQDEIEQAAVEYSMALGISKLDLKPLTGRMAGTATQSAVMDSQGESSGLGLWSGAFEDFINECVTPSTVSFFWAFNKTSAKKAEAEVAGLYVSAATGMVGSQMLLPAQANNWLVDKDVMDASYLSEGDITQTQILGEDDKPDVVNPDKQVSPDGKPQPGTAQPQAQGQGQGGDVMSQAAHILGV